MLQVVIDKLLILRGKETLSFYSGLKYALLSNIFLFYVQFSFFFLVKGPSIITYTASRLGGGGLYLLYVSCAYYRQNEGGGVQIACKTAYIYLMEGFMEVILLAIENISLYSRGILPLWLG